MLCYLRGDDVPADEQAELLGDGVAEVEEGGTVTGVAGQHQQLGPADKNMMVLITKNPQSYNLNYGGDLEAVRLLYYPS